MKWLLLALWLAPFIGARWSPWCFKVAFGWDMLASAYSNGLPGESLSGRAGSALEQGHLRGRIFAPLIDLIFGKGHCIRAAHNDVLRGLAEAQDQAR